MIGNMTNNVDSGYWKFRKLLESEDTDLAEFSEIPIDIHMINNDKFY